MKESVLLISIDVARQPNDRAERGGESQHALPTEVVAALSDADSRAILSAVAEEFRPVSELAAACEIPLSTTYRKVHTLVETGLLDERSRIRPTGKHTHEYRLRPASLEVALTVSGDLEVACSLETQRSATESSSSQDTATEPHAIETDGGTEPSASTTESGLRPLPQLFVDVTGTEKLLEEQSSPVSSREIDETSTELSTYLRAVVTDDGLTDAIDDHERGEAE